ncbi:hypothetical protein [Sporolituus thermophilus]|uniref:Uncharacterized protein n=1 Tax=Sporolituus thermophilus DSM 23256 TaxID=1123285 RepID=A0A1G7IPQ9_9FIRM|nr:hypothetical protein [Sporolituus thermophilus]SDF14603.1 hypothetical protein SAMN05660235_00574 [Sporolituus thermophilus DSM 23256]
MIEEYKLEVPEFASLRQENCPCNTDGPCSECCNKGQNATCNIATGRTVPGNVPNHPGPNCCCHDICVEEVTHICTHVVNVDIPYPPVGRCRINLPQGVTFPTLTPNEVCQVVITCAEEELDASCQAINVQVGIMIICQSGQCAVALPTCIRFTCDFSNTFDFATCTGVPNAAAMREIISKTDGSCIKAVLRAQVNATGDRIELRGKIIDKLWRHENLWVMAVQPYPEIENFAQFTVKSEFTTFSHNFPLCNNIACPTCP